MSDFDRFDRMLLAVPPAEPVLETTTPPRLTTRPVHTEREPVVHSTRPARFVDHTICPMCGIDRIGVEYHGTLMSGAKVHQVAVHTAGIRRTEKGQPLCLGARMRVVFEGGTWKGAPAQ